MANQDPPSFTPRLASQISFCLFVFPGKGAAVTTPPAPSQLRVLFPAGDAEQCGAMRSDAELCEAMRINAGRCGAARIHWTAPGRRARTAAAAAAQVTQLLGGAPSLSTCFGGHCKPLLPWSHRHRHHCYGGRRGVCWTGVMACPGLRREANCRETASILSKAGMFPSKRRCAYLSCISLTR